MSNLKKINAKCKSIATTYAKVNALVHEACLLIFDHAKATGDCRPLKTLYDAMPASARRSKMLDWFSTFSPVRFNESTGLTGFDKKYTKTPLEEKAAWWKREDGDSNPWHQLAERDPEAKVYDFKALVAMVERIAKQIEKKVEEGLVPDEDVPSAHAIANRIKHLDFKRVKVEPANEVNEQPQPEPIVING